MSRKIKWGIVGLGNIAHYFVKDLLLVEEAELTAVASRDLKKAEDFAKTYNAVRFYNSYDDLFLDDLVSIVYIATPHHSHAELSMKAMKAGKHVLCEKPMAVNAIDAQHMIDTAKENKVFFMEGLWARFNPSIQKVLHLLNEGVIGKVNYLNADFSFLTPKNKDGRLYNIALAGGALLDIGIYPLFLSYMIFGKPIAIKASALMDEGGVDVQTSMILKYKNAFSNLYCGFKSDSDMVAKIYGTDGAIYIDKKWYETQGFRVVKNGKETVYDLPTVGKGFYYEIRECIDCIKNDAMESSLWSHQNSLDIIKLMDAIREMIGLKYPFE